MLPSIEETPAASGGFFQRLSNLILSLSTNLGAKSLFVLAIGGFVGGSFLMLNVFADLYPESRIAYLRASAGLAGTASTGSTTFDQAKVSVCDPNYTPSEKWLGCYYTYSNMSVEELEANVVSGINIFDPIYFANAREDAKLKFDWTGENGQPDRPGMIGVGPDKFAVRWYGNFSFNQGTYDFTATADDGVRVYIDGKLVLDKWFSQSPTTYNFKQDLTAGVHKIVVEYFELAGWAVASLDWNVGQVADNPPVPKVNCENPGISVAAITGSSAYPGFPYVNAVDNNVNTMWNAGGSAPQWIRLDLGENYSITKICVNPEMSPQGRAKHTILAGNTTTSLSQIGVIEKDFVSSQWVEQSISGTGRYVMIRTDVSPSWVAWREVKLFGNKVGGDIPPITGTCPDARVVVKPQARLTVGQEVTFEPSNLSDFHTLSYSTSNSSVLEVAGVKGYGRAFGTVQVSGQGFSQSANKFCPLAATNVQVEPERAAGYLLPRSDLTIGFCASRPHDVTVSTVMTAGTARIEITGQHQAIPASQYVDPVTPWTQRIYSANINGSGQYPTITIKLIDRYYADNVLATLTITRDTPCENNLGTPSLTVGEVYSACGANLSGYVNTISAHPGSVSATLRVENAGSFQTLVGLTPNENWSSTNQDVGHVTDNQILKFSLIEAGSGRDLVTPIVRTVLANTSCSPTGSITPGTVNLSTCSLNGAPSSVELTATITTPFGRGVVEQSRTSGYTLPTNLSQVTPGGMVKFTVNASQMGLYTAETFNIRESSGSLVAGAGAVVYRDDRNCPNQVFTPSISGIEGYYYVNGSSQVDKDKTQPDGFVALYGNFSPNGDNQLVTLGSVGGTIVNQSSRQINVHLDNSIGTAEFAIRVGGQTSNSKSLPVPAFSGTGTLSIISPSTTNFFETCSDYVDVQMRVENLSDVRLYQNLKLSLNGVQVPPNSRLVFTDRVYVPNDSVVLKTYNITYGSQIIAYDNITLRRQCVNGSLGKIEARPSNHVVAYNSDIGYAEIVASNFSTSLTMSVNIDGYTYSVAPNSYLTGIWVPIRVGESKTYTLQNTGSAVAPSVTITAERQNF